MLAMDSPGDTPGGPSGDENGQTGTATVTVDTHGVIRGWSEGACRLLGYGPAQALGGSTGGLLGEEAAGTLRQALAAMREWNGPLKLSHRDGRLLQVDASAYPSVGADGTATLFLVLDRERAVRPYEALADLGFEKAPLPLAIYDPQTGRRRMNQAARRDAGLMAKGVCEGRRVAQQEAQDGEDDLRFEVTVPAAEGRRRRTWAVSTSRVHDCASGLRGEISVAFDITEQQAARQRLALLNEAGTRIGTTLDLTRTTQELADLSVSGLADFASVNLLDSVLLGDEQAPGLLTGPVSLRRTAQQSILEGCPEAAVRIGEADTYPQPSPVARCLATGEPVLSKLGEPEHTRWLAVDKERSARGVATGIHSVMVVPLRARGITMGVAFFARHRNPVPFDEDDRLLGAELAARAAVCVDNARRFTRERDINLALQRSLLPQRLPDQSAVGVATRYLPASAHAGVGGDWFDVIPLSGARVALVVGDVVGHGVHASATMGRLRTAVRTLADVDLPPDELLTRLNDLVIRLSAESDSDGGAGDVMGATCLYAVYDPTSGQCVMARAGHPPPVVVTPGASAALVDLPACPPLGLAGLPFESAELHLPPGSLLALYTDGLVESRDRDIEEGIDGLRGVLNAPAPTIEATCDAVVATLLPSRPFDDATLLLARTHTLNARDVATWELSEDPALVSWAREQVTAQLVAWALDDLVFTTELVVSELITNAIRYADAPIRLRLIKDRTLICEISDASNTAPHLRHARTLDEGGRGLLLVAQLTDRWGTRQSTRGKTIWAEQQLPSGH
jgi:serine phosphatase RsbU (regulator of sigma subunit)/PAS domain-containing protein/anti-sigma regulatory factor (Ser/Thr protein kinase)